MAGAKARRRIHRLVENRRTVQVRAIEAIGTAVVGRRARSGEQASSGLESNVP